MKLLLLSLIVLSAGFTNANALTYVSHGNKHVNEYRLKKAKPAALAFPAIPSKVYGTADFAPGATSSNPITYTSSNTSIATIVSGMIHIVATGSSTITANDGTTTLTQKITVTRALLTVTGVQTSITYGQVIPAFTVTYSGFVNNDTNVTALTTQPTVSTAVTSTSPVGTAYSITPSGAASTLYTFKYVSATGGHILAAPLTITANSITLNQGAMIPALTVSYIGFANSETSSVLTTQPTVTTTATSTSPQGTYPITASGAAASNYTITYAAGTTTIVAALVFPAIPSKVYGTVDFSPGATSSSAITYTSSNANVATIVSGQLHIIASGTSTITAKAGTNTLTQTLTVTKAPLTVTASSASIIYGAGLPVFTANYTGFVNGDTTSTLTTAPTVRTTATATASVGTYTTTASGAVSTKYAFTYVGGTYIINKAALTITANSYTQKAGTAIPALSATYSGFVNSETNTVLTTQPKVTTTATSTSQGGVYPVTASGAVAKNYSITYVAGTFTVVAALNFPALTTVTYGVADFSPGATDASAITYTSANTKVATIVAGQIHVVGAGTSVITATDGTNTAKQTLTVNLAPLTVIPTAVSSVYGATIPVFTVTCTGLVGGDTNTTAFTTQPTVTSNAPATSTLLNVGTYTLTASGAVSTKYSLTYATANLTITPATLTITADDVSLPQGSSPAYQYGVIYSGFQGADNAAALSLNPQTATSATASSPVGTYPITVQGGGTAANYNITYVNGTLSILAGSQFNTSPSLQYPSPIIVNEGINITPVIPTNSGGPIAPYTNIVSTIAGSGANGFVNGFGTAASFDFTKQDGVAIDASGNFFVADQANNVIRKIFPDGLVVTFAGTGVAGSANGAGATASFNGPCALVVSPFSGNIYVCDAGNNLIRKITPAGVVTTLGGTGTPGNTNGALSTSSFNKPSGITIDGSGILYVLEPANNDIRRIYGNTTVSTLYTDPSFAADNYISCDPTVGQAPLYITGTDNTIRDYDQSTGLINVIAGASTAGFSNNKGTAARFSMPAGLAFVPGTTQLLVADQGNNLIRSVDVGTGVVATYSGTRTGGNANGVPSTALYLKPAGIATNSGNVLAIIDAGNKVIKKQGVGAYTCKPVLPAGLSFDNVTGAISGTSTASWGLYTFTVSSYNGGGAATSTFTLQSNNAIPAASSPNIYTIAGNGTAGSTGDGGPASVATLQHPYGLAIDKKGNMYLACYGDNKIRKVDAVTKVITTYAGTGNAAYNGDGGLATAADFNLGNPALALDAAGNLYISDQNNNVVRKIDVNTNIVTTIAGTGTGDFTGDGGPATSAALSGPEGLVFDNTGNLYISDVYNGRVRKIDSATQVITTVAGGGDSSYVHTAISPLDLAIAYAERITMDKANNLYIADGGSGEVIKIDATTNLATRVAGIENSQYSGDGGLAVNAGFYYMMDIQLDATNNIYIADQSASVIRKIDAVTKKISTYAGIVSQVYSGDGGAATLAGLNQLTDLRFDGSGNLIVCDLGNQVVRRIGGTAMSQTLTFPTTTKVYGVADFSPATTTSGLPVNYTSSDTTVASVVSNNLHVIKVGSATITAVQPGNANYTTTTTLSRALTVTAAPLTITANSLSKQQGTVNPALTATYTGFVNNETSDVLTTLPTLSTTAITNSAAGTYPITAKGAVGSNYKITYVAGVLTVTTPAGSSIVSNNPDELSNDPTQPMVKQALSANGDGVNDVLTVRNITNFPDNKLVIINSNGTKVFEAAHYDNVNKPFNGYSNITGAKQKAGTYYYILDYKDGDASKHKTGFLIIK